MWVQPSTATHNRPLHDKTTLETEPQGETEVDAGHYQSIVGSLSYAATATRPDIAFAVSALSRYNSRPFTSHLTAAKRVLRYLKGTADLKLVFPRIPVTPSPILGFTDSDFAGDINGRKSQGGYVFQVYNGPVSWKSYNWGVRPVRHQLGTPIIPKSSVRRASHPKGCDDLRKAELGSRCIRTRDKDTREAVVERAVG